MALLRCLVMAVLLSCPGSTDAQGLYYPAKASTLLRSTAADLGQLLKKAIPGFQPILQIYNGALPATGIGFIYDSTITDQKCRIESNGISYLRFSAAEDNGIVLGVYEYLRQLGFIFWQPGSLWETIPVLTSPYKNTNQTVAYQFQYNTWFISGGHNVWSMDKNTAYGWDTNFGDNGHAWSLYQRRNRMTGAYRFAGHRSDIYTGAYQATLQNNPCYVAAHNGSRQASIRSVPDIGNTAAIELWANSLENKFTYYKSAVYGNTNLYADLYRNFSYAYRHIGIEVSDGAQWGNSQDDGSCGNMAYPKESDQQFILAGKTAQLINSRYPGKRFQCYAYHTHADIPSANITINPNIDVQVVPTAFQSLTSPIGLLNRWYNRHNYISEYHYLNIPQWGGETPLTSATTLKQTVQRIKEKNRQGISWEASPAKFASLPYLLSATNALEHNIPFDTTLKRFTTAMFGEGASTLYELLQSWSDERIITVGDFIPDNKYKIPYWFKLFDKAVQQTANSNTLVKQRLTEWKAYLHYLVLYYNWLFDQRPHSAKETMAGELCVYLAKINRMQLVNSFFLITDIVSRYPSTSEFYTRYNPATGTAYANGTLPLITTAEIEANYTTDLAIQQTLVNQFQFETPAAIIGKMKNAQLAPLPKIDIRIGYTNGYDSPNRCEFYINAPTAGSFTIAYKPRFDMPGKGSINFTVENTAKTLGVVKDFTLANGSNAGSLSVQLPEAGTYKLSIVSKHKSYVEVSVTTNGNYFYKPTAFLGNKTENYRSNLTHLPGYLYVPAGVSKVYFSVNNSNPGGTGFATAAQVGQSFLFTDAGGNPLQPALVTPAEGALFYLSVGNNPNGMFIRAGKMEQYNACFANISNTLWCAEKKNCADANFYTSIVLKNGDCITRLTAANDKTDLQWSVTDGPRHFTYNTAIVDLPNYISPNTIVTLKASGNCITTKRLADDTGYLRRKEACGNGAPLPGKSILTLYPNPGNGVVYCMQDQNAVKAEEIIITDLLGKVVLRLTNTSRIDISRFTPGVYLYRCKVTGEWQTGKLVKQ
jgi:hypothetical protein